MRAIVVPCEALHQMATPNALEKGVVSQIATPLLVVIVLLPQSAVHLPDPTVTMEETLEKEIVIGFPTTGDTPSVHHPHVGAMEARLETAILPDTGVGVEAEVLPAVQVVIEGGTEAEPRAGVQSAAPALEINVLLSVRV